MARYEPIEVSWRRVTASCHNVLDAIYGPYLEAVGRPPRSALCWGGWVENNTRCVGVVAMCSPSRADRREWKGYALYVPRTLQQWKLNVAGGQDIRTTYVLAPDPGWLRFNRKLAAKRWCVRRYQDWAYHDAMMRLDRSGMEMGAPGWSYP